MRRNRVVVVGAGIGGLACAIELVRRGFAVTVVEKAARPGGKMRQAQAGDAALDAGPTVLTMPWVFEALFDAAGADFRTAVRLNPAEVLARHAWSGDERLDLFADIDRSADAIGAFAGAREAKGYRAFCAESKAIFDTLRSSFLTAQQTGPVGLSARIGLGRMGDLMALRPFDTLWRALGDHFHDPRLHQLFGRYATYCGASPFQSPATLMLVAHVEQAGVWLVEGGMQRLAEALEALALTLGVDVRYGAAAARIRVEGGRAAGVVLETGEDLAADHAVVNADTQALAQGLFGEDATRATPRRPRSARSLSAVTWALHGRSEGFPLSRHNVFFSNDYAGEFEDIFKRRRLPEAPTVYVCAQDRSAMDAPTLEPSGPERLLLLVNAPPDGDRGAIDEGDLIRCQTQVFDHLNRCGLRISPEAEMSRTTPTDFEALFPATGGALYGPATHGWAAAFQRPGARTKVPGLYLAGGGAHPGAGVPMAALSGRLAAERLAKDHASTFRSRKGVIAGGTSTP